MSAARSKDTYLAAKYRRIASGVQRAVPIRAGSDSSAAATVAHWRHRSPEGMSVKVSVTLGMVCLHCAST